MKGLHILVIGGGIAGLALGRLLGRRHNVRIVEKAESLHTSGTGLMLGINAMQVLQRMNLAGEVKSKGRELDRFVISDHRDRPLSTLQFSKQVRARGLGLYSIHRSRLSEILFQGLEPHTSFNASVRGLREDARGVHAEFSDGTSRSFDLVIGADGSHSRTRQLLAPDARLRYSGYTCWRFMIASEPHDKPVEMWGRGQRIGIVPLNEEETYVFLLINARPAAEDVDTFEPARMKQAFAYFHGIAPEILGRLENARVRVHNDLFDLPTPVLGSRRILLAGDAAHAATPNMGQGAGLAIEDAWVLSQTIDLADSIEDVQTVYGNRRSARVKQIVKMSHNLGRVAHWESHAATWLRNRLLALIPDSVNTRHMENLLLNF
jgi:2-polyprenyl-6-methoxyphenol hydroxylase-like FAD-dependent oxidoreductase